MVQPLARTPLPVCRHLILVVIQSRSPMQLAQPFLMLVLFL